MAHQNAADDFGAARTLAGQAYSRLRQDIVTGELQGGEKLKLEALSKRYGIGMSPLREALARLAGDALVLTEGQRGFWVSALSIEEFEDITRVRALIETEARYGAGGAAQGVSWALSRRPILDVNRDRQHGLL